MARYNMRVAAEWIERLHDVEENYFEEMVRRLHLRPEEPEEWRKAADAMYIPFDDEHGIHPQDAHFLEREVWNKGQEQPKRPLLLHYHPLTIYRYQVIKQADVVLALFLRGSEFSEKARRADFDYYDPLTTGDSSLSSVVQCIVAAEFRRATNHLVRAKKQKYPITHKRYRGTWAGVHPPSTIPNVIGTKTIAHAP